MHKKIMKDCASKLKKDAKQYEKKAKTASTLEKKREKISESKATNRAANMLKKMAK